MKRHWKKIAIAVAALVVIVVGGSLLYTKVINKPDPAFGQKDVNAKLDVASTTLAPADTSAGAAAGTAAAAAPAGSVDGVWNIKTGSEVGYRVKESINGFDTVANGRTQAVTGSIVIDGTKITKGQFSVDMTTIKSDESRRDSQFNGRIMDVSQFPTSTFALTQPIDLGQVPADGGSVKASATGDLTLHGTTNTVTFDVDGTFKNGLVGVLGQIPVVFADYGIPAPSFGPVRAEDNGLLEFVLVLQHA